MNNEHVLLTSLADAAHPSTLCTLSANAYDVKFISATEIGYAINSSPDNPSEGTTLIQRVSLSDPRPVTLATIQGVALDVAWSPDGSSFAYIASTYAPNAGDGNQLWVKVGSAAPRAVTPLISFGGRDGSIDDETVVRFSYDGRYLVMVDTFVAGPAPASPDQAPFQVHSMPDGNLVWVPPSALDYSGKLGPFVTMAAWAHRADRLYYRDVAGVHTWDPPSTPGTLAPSLTWYSPSMSPDDQIVAFGLDMGTGPHIEVRDLATSSVRGLAGLLGSPILLSDTVMIESHYGPNAQGPGPAYLGTGWYILNLQTNVETPFPGISELLDVWQ